MGILTITFSAISDSLSLQRKTLTLKLTADYTNELEKKIEYITQYNSKAYYKTALKKVSVVNPENANIICDYILAEQTQMNIKESTKEGKMKVLIWLTNFFQNKKSFREMTKQDILEYLNDLRKLRYNSNHMKTSLLERMGGIRFLISQLQLVTPVNFALSATVCLTWMEER